jgi:predicted Rossmann fold flavoprotein
MTTEGTLKVAVIGAGAAGLVAAAEAAQRNASVLLLEKNVKTGVKILMSGGTRCNLTHQTDAKGIARAFGPAGRFLQPSLGAFSPADVVQMFHDLGVPTKVESTGKIFPASDRALHVRDALVRRATQVGVSLQTGDAVQAIRPLDPQRWQITTTQGEVIVNRVIVTSGGKSWPACGTTGDGYAWLSRLGHRIVTPRPALVPLIGGADWMHELSGVTLEDCLVSVIPRDGSRRKPLTKRRSSLLLTHLGFSGPAAMDVSGTLTAAPSFAEMKVLLDSVPEMNESELRDRLTDRSREGGRQRVATVLAQWLPNRFAVALATQAKADCTIAELPRRTCARLLDSLKRLPLGITGTLGFNKAEVTAGGVCLDEVDPRTMQSRIVPGLFIAGEVLDVDGPIGGYNFQAAFSTGRAAGIAAANFGEASEQR